MNKTSTLLICVLCGLTLLPSVASAQSFQQEVSERFERDFDEYHDQGLQLRLGAGATYGSTYYVEGQVEDAGALWAQWDLYAGWLISEGLSVGLEQWGRTRASTGVLSAGLGLSFYPDAGENLWGGLSVGVATPWGKPYQAFEQLGLSAQAQLGTGWWLSGAWSGGVALAAGATHVDLDRDGELVAGWSIGIMFTITGD